MKQLLTCQEAYAGMKNIYKEDANGKPYFETVGEPKGRIYQDKIKTDITGEELESIFKAIGLGDYFEAESCEGMLYVRYYGPEEPADTSSIVIDDAFVDALIAAINDRTEKLGYFPFSICGTDRKDGDPA